LALWTLFALLATATLFAIVYWFFNGKTFASADNLAEVAKAAVTSIGVMAGGAGAAVALRRQKIQEDQAQLSKDALFSDRYRQAIDQLGSESTKVQLGGVYALERLLADNVDRDDAQAVVNALTAHVRSPRREEGKVHQEPLEVVVAVEALDRIKRRRPYVEVDLRRANLAGLHLAGLRLAGFLLVGTNFEGANLRGARLAGAQLSAANLQNADLFGADLREANLSEASLVGAFLAEASLTEANLTFADLTRVTLYDADLSRAVIYDSDLTGAILMGATLLEADLSRVCLSGASISGVRADHDLQEWTMTTQRTPDHFPPAKVPALVPA